MPSTNTLLAIAKSKATANRLAKALTIQQIESAINHLNATLNAARKRDANKQAKKRAADIKKLTAIMADMGLSANDVAKLANKKTAQRRPSKKKAGARKGKKGGGKIPNIGGRENRFSGPVAVVCPWSFVNSSPTVARSILVSSTSEHRLPAH